MSSIFFFSSLRSGLQSLEDGSEMTKSLIEADALLNSKPSEALQLFTNIVQASSVVSPRAIFGKARALDLLAAEQHSNRHLEEAINTYQQVIRLKAEVPTTLLFQAARFCADRMRFRGWSSKAVAMLKDLVKSMPNETEPLNLLGMQFLYMNQKNAAKEMFEAALLLEPSHRHSARHLGWILKNSQANSDELERGVKLMLQGIQGDEEVEGNIFLALGDGLRRLEREEEANQIYEQGVQQGVFLSFWQRSMYNVAGLKSKPIWSLKETGAAQGLRKLEHNWNVIRDEALHILHEGEKGFFQPEAEGLQDTGDWRQFTLFEQGRKNEKACAKTPKTCSLIGSIEAARSNKRGQVKFSVMYPGTHVFAHSGPTNCRLRAHLGLKVPEGHVKMRVADQFLSWEEGKVLVFDDSFDHEVWHEGQGERIILIVDLWHPQLDLETKKSLQPI